MFHLTINIDREVSVDELKVFVQACTCIKEGDRFVVTTDEIPAEAPSRPVIVAGDGSVMTPDKTEATLVPDKPAEPVKARPYARRPWSVRIEEAFGRTLQTLPNLDIEVQTMQLEFAWTAPKEEWSEVEFKKIPLPCHDRETAERIIRCVLKNLGMQPPASARRFLLPPKADDWQATVEERQRRQREANLKLTGDEHIGTPIVWHPKDATVSKDVMRDLLESLDWESKEKTPMYTREFLEANGIPWSQGNAVRLGVMAKDFGGLEVAQKTRLGYKYAFPPVKK